MLPPNADPHDDLSPLRVGERVVVISSDCPEFPAGTEVSILGVVKPPEYMRDHIYVIAVCGIDQWLATREGLRRLRPPPRKQELGSWKELEKMGLCPSDVEELA